jgi:hypothetical protein
MEDLGAGVSAEVTNAACPVIGACCQVPSVKLSWAKGLLFELVILAKKAVKGTSMIEDSQVFVSVFGTPGVGITGVA